MFMFGLRDRVEYSSWCGHCPKDFLPWSLIFWNK